MCTFGQLLESLRGWAQSPDGSPEAVLELADWAKMLKPEELAELCASQLSTQQVDELGELLAAGFRDLISRTFTDALIIRRMADGHKLLKALARLVREAGLEIGDDEIDCPLTPSEMLMAVARPPQLDAE